MRKLTMLDKILGQSMQEEVAFRHLLHQAKQNGRSGGQYFVRKPITVSKVVKLLNDASYSRNIRLKGRAKLLIRWMADRSWLITASWHKGGLGSRHRPPDQTLHITIRIAGRGSYHLRADKRQHLFDITGRGL